MKNIKVSFPDAMESRTADMLLDAVNTAIIDDVNYTANSHDHVTLYWPKNSDVLDYIVVCAFKGIAPAMVTFKYKNGLVVDGRAYRLNRTNKEPFNTFEVTGIELPRF